MMWYGFRVKLVLISLVIGLVCFFGGQWLYDKYGYQQSLQQALTRQPQVAGFETEDKNGKLMVTIHLRSTGNLMKTYQQLRGAVAEALVNRPFVLQLADKRDRNLEEVFYHSQFAIYQALAQGSFKEMETEIKSNASRSGTEARIYLDNENIYLTLTRGNRFMATVISRNPSPKIAGGINPYA